MDYKPTNSQNDESKKKAKSGDVLLFHPAKDKESLKRAIVNCLRYEESKDSDTAVYQDYLLALAWAIKHQLVDRWIETQKYYHKSNCKQVYYLSLEYLTGQSMRKNMINLGIYDACEAAMADLGLNLDQICDMENDAALGNGGLGRLAACYLDSMATVGLPAHGYGLRYEYGIFKQAIEHGEQVEQPDNWLKEGAIWEIKRPEHVYEVRFRGTIKEKKKEDGTTYSVWTDSVVVLAEAYDFPYIGYNNNNVNTLRLWDAEPTQEFNLEYFSHGDYLQAVEEKAMSKSITRVLYPNDAIEKGFELRLYQEYFLVSATLQDIIHHFKFKNDNFDNFPDKVAIQLNDTHPALAIPELMRVLLDQEGLLWDRAWDICRKTFSYTNHTILPEALERWPIKVMEKILPRHMQLIYEINSHFLRTTADLYPHDKDILRRVSLIEGDGDDKRINMAHLSIIGSHKVNGVSKLHTQILKDELFKDFDHLFPGLIVNKTNGITPRRWLRQCNYPLFKLLHQKLGFDFLTDLTQLRKIEPFINDEDFLKQWQEVKTGNKQKLADYIEKILEIKVSTSMLFDAQIKRIHQYKRQMMNIMHVVALYNEIKRNPQKEHVPRCVIFAGKAAPSYVVAKLIIKLINMVAFVINHDPQLDKILKVVFIPDYKVSLAEKIIPAADLSEQISTAGYEASGTGNMKFALNGALTIGTLDGANVEMLEEVGADNLFIFGKKAHEIKELKAKGYTPMDYYNQNPVLKEVLDMIGDGHFNLEEPDLFKPLTENLLHEDSFCILADFMDYVECQKKVSEAFKDKKSWTVKSILNTARMGKFSSDRAVREYADEIWKIEPYKVSDIQYDTPTNKEHPNAPTS